MRFSLGVIAFCLCATSASAEFTLRFDSWGDIPLCTSGRSKSVGNPEFILTGVPAGTTTVQFYLKNLNLPAVNHGGSKRLPLTADGRIPANTFKYLSPCPINGINTYEWKATSRAGKKISGNAKAKRQYPE